VDEFPSNSNHPKRDDVSKVVTNDVIIRKPSLGKRFKTVFFKGDSRSSLEYVAQDILIPAAKDMIVDAIESIARSIFYGPDMPQHRRGRQPFRSQQTRVSYGAYSSKPPQPKRPGRMPAPTQRASLDDVILTTRAEAEDVLNRLEQIIDRYEFATVSDLYDLLGITTNHAEERLGWSSVRHTSIVRVREGYLLSLPDPEQISR
jgi:hypothetical protein